MVNGRDSTSSFLGVALLRGVLNLVSDKNGFSLSWEKTLAIRQLSSYHSSYRKRDGQINRRFILLPESFQKTVAFGELAVKMYPGQAKLQAAPAQHSFTTSEHSRSAREFEFN